MYAIFAVCLEHAARIKKHMFVSTSRFHRRGSRVQHLIPVAVSPVQHLAQAASMNHAIFFLYV